MRTTTPSRTLVLAALTFGLAACGSDTPIGPTPIPTPTIASVNPTSGFTTGGTEVTITGTNFAAGAAVTIGGVAATGVQVQGSTVIKATTGQHAAGAVDVVVTVGTATAVLPSAYTYQLPPPNPPPVITAVTVQGTRLNEPAGFADLGEEVVVTATVTDAETPVDRLTFEWTAEAGTFTGSGAAVRWRAPASAATPTQVTITVKVTEATLAAADRRAAGTQSVTATAKVALHDSVGEIAEMSRQFLLYFSDNTVPAEAVVRDFWPGCPGRASELSDTIRIRNEYVINSHQIGAPTMVLVDFNGECVLADRRRAGDGCVHTPVLWRSTVKASGKTETATGLDQTTAVYRESRWWLCDSDFVGTTSSRLGAILSRIR